MTDSRGAVIGHAMAADACVAGRLESNIGLVIADDWQQQGLGTGLLSLLVGRAAERGVSTLVLDVLPANDRMRGIISRRWPDAPIGAHPRCDRHQARDRPGAAFQGGFRAPDRSAA